MVDSQESREKLKSKESQKSRKMETTEVAKAIMLITTKKMVVTKTIRTKHKMKTPGSTNTIT
jgi:hypothetical protein